MLKVQINLKTSAVKIYVLLFILSSTSCWTSTSFGTIENLNLKDMSTSAVIITVNIVFILLTGAIIVNLVAWVIPLHLFKQMINKFKKKNIMF
jgi:hypothetical protein